jgi:hypothetical protein
MIKDGPKPDTQDVDGLYFSVEHDGVILVDFLRGENIGIEEMSVNTAAAGVSFCFTRVGGV